MTIYLRYFLVTGIIFWILKPLHRFWFFWLNTFFWSTMKKVSYEFYHGGSVHILNLKWNGKYCRWKSFADGGVPFSALWWQIINPFIPACLYLSKNIGLTKAKLLREVTLTEAHLGSFLNFSQLACKAKFKIEPKCPAVKVTFLSKVALLHLLNDFLYEIEWKSHSFSTLYFNEFWPHCDKAR